MLKNLTHDQIDQELFANVESKNNQIVDEDDVIRSRWDSKSLNRKIALLMIAQKCFREKKHDRIDKSSNDARSSYWYEDYQSYENARFSNWFKDHLSIEMLSNSFEDSELCCHFELKISSALRFESEISLFDSNE